MNIIYVALLSPIPPDPAELRRKGFIKWDLEQAYRLLLRDLGCSNKKNFDKALLSQFKLAQDNYHYYCFFF